MIRACLAMVVLTACSNAGAEVVASSASGFHSRNSITVAATPDDTFQAMTRELAYWWDGAHSHSGKAEYLSLTRDCFCEHWAANHVVHMDVVRWQPRGMVVMTGGLGPLQGLGIDGALTWGIEAVEGDKVTITWDYRVHGWHPDGLEAIAAGVDAVLRGQLERLARYTDSGDPQAGPG